MHKSYSLVVVSACVAGLFAACAGTRSSTSSPPQVAAPPPAPMALAPPGPSYPPAPRGDVVDDYHGTKVADPYRWLEQLDSPQTAQWVEAQNKLSQPVLQALPHREWLKQRLAQLWNYERFEVPTKAGKHYFFRRNDGQQNQSVLYVTDSLDSNGRVLFDPNTVREDATIALSEYTPSPDGNLVAYALSDGGTDWETWKFRRTKDGTDLDDTLRNTKFWGVSWLRDGSGVYYSRYPALADGKPDGAAQPVVYFHRLGESQEKDQLVYRVTDHPTRVPAARVTEDGRYLVITLFDGYDRNAVYVRDLKDVKQRVKPLLPAWDALYELVGSKGDELFFQTTKDAARGRVVAVNAKRPAPEAWRTIVPESDIALASASYVGRRIIANYVRDVHSEVKIFEASGKAAGEVKLPGLGNVGGFTGEGGNTDTFFTYTDFLTPTAIYHYVPAENRASPWRAPHISAATDVFVTEQVFYKSKDGTRVPMFITHRRDMQKNGDQPTLLYGYGGFKYSLMPAFQPAVLAWLEMGGVFAEANLRGGGEYGEAWHQAGTRLNKQNVFDDFIAAAEYLIGEDYTRTPRLGIHGRSNGGLLVGAVMTQRPDLFGATLPGVGVLDMLRYQTASANARQWSSDLGISENPDEFHAQYAYSPVHNVKPGTCYPPTLVTTADHDDRVVPWHSFKFTSALQNAQSCAHPILIRIETRAGHGAGKPVWMQIEDYADQWAFLANTLKMAPPPSGGT